MSSFLVAIIPLTHASRGIYSSSFSSSNYFTQLFIGIHIYTLRSFSIAIKYSQWTIKVTLLCAHPQKYPLSKNKLSALGPMLID